MKKKVLIFIDWYLPGYKAGGPIKSIANVIARFRDEWDIAVVTSDRDLGDTSPYEYIRFNDWQQKDGYKVIYLTPSECSIRRYKTIYKSFQPDVVYFNNLFSVSFTFKPLLLARLFAKKIILAPRGMLGDGALKIKPLKKKIFLFFARQSGLFKNIHWQATAETEYQEIKKHFGEKAKVILAPNFSSQAGQKTAQRKKEAGAVELFFLSRISEKKNLLFALNVLTSILPPAQITYHILGPVDGDAYWQKCQLAIQKLPPHIKVEQIGAVPNHRLEEFLQHYHFLFLPTQHENYGHAILEALSSGCPIIISDQTPWRRLQDVSNLEQEVEGSDGITSTDYQAFGKNNQMPVGWDLPLSNPEIFTKVIEQCAAMGQEEYNNMSRNAFEYAKTVINDPEVLEANRRLFG